MAIRKIRIGYKYREIPLRGPIVSDTINSSSKEISIDLTNIADRYNTYVHPVLAGLPSGLANDGAVGGRWPDVADTLPDAFTDGLDGKTIFTDNDAVTGEDLYDETNLRPLTVAETAASLQSQIDILGDSQEPAYIRTFIGKGAAGNVTPSYAYNYNVIDGDNLVTAIDKLDNAINGVSVRAQYSFSNTGTNIITWTHGMGIQYPLVQVVDLRGASSDVLADEVYTYEKEQSLPYSETFVSIEFTSTDILTVYTNIADGIIVGVF